MKTEKQLERIVKKAVDKSFSEEEQDLIEWYVDKETTVARICRGVYKGLYFELHVNKLDGNTTYVWSKKEKL